MYIKLKQLIIILLILYLQVFINAGYGQAKSSGGFGYFSTGFQRIDFTELDRVLTQYNYPKLNKNMISFGGAGFAMINGFLMGGEGHGMMGSEISNNNYMLSVNAGYGLFNLGYSIYSKRRLLIFSGLGFGGGALEIRIKEKQISDFDDIIHNPKRGSVLNLGGLMFNLGFNLIYSLIGENDGYGGLLIGVSVGYTHFIKLGNWELFDSEIPGGPVAGISGLYLRLSVGGGGFTQITEKESVD